MNADDQYEDFLRSTSEPQPAPPIQPVDDVSEQYLAARKDANAPSSAAWKGAIRAGMDPGEVVLGKPIFDRIETRSDGERTYKVGIDDANPENNVLLAIGDIVAGTGKGIVSGLQEAGDQIGDTLTGGYWSSAISPWLRENASMLGEANEALADALTPSNDTQKIAASIASPLAQVVLPGAVLTRTFRAAGIGSRFLAEGLGYGAAEVAAVDPKDMTLLELGVQLLDDVPELQRMMNASLGAQEGETEFLERVKNAPRRFLEGGPMGMVFERALRAVGTTYRAVANSPGRKRPAATEVPAAPDRR
jgi:hypothetical protein